jgi:hypothetical protein
MPSRRRSQPPSEHTAGEERLLALKYRLRPAFARLQLLALLLALVLALPLPFASTDVSAEGGSRVYDDGAVLVSRDPVSAIPIELTIEFFTDPPPAVWPRESIPVEICSQQSNRPFAYTADDFRDVVASATSMWTGVGVGVGFQYIGDCTQDDRWQFDNGLTEVGFDDFRDVVKGQSAGVATGTWTTLFGTKEFVEFDVVLDERLNVPLQCFESIVAHELGHVLGLGHSDDERDLMFASFDPNDLDTCPTEARPIEVDALRVLYGNNLAPVFEEPPTLIADAGAEVVLTVDASDAEDDALRFEWEQLDGDPVEFVGEGDTLRFTAPDAPGAELRFQVTAIDPIGHATSVEVLIGIDSTPEAPSGMPTLVSIDVTADGADAGFTWALPEATSFELCTGGPAPGCERSTAGTLAIDWETVVATAGSPTARRVFTSGARETSAAACNAAGCGPAMDGPLAGGLRWIPWDVDFDYFGMAMDASNFRMTIGGVTNLSDQPRSFTLYSGTDTSPRARVIKRCGVLEAGEACLGLLLPTSGGHGTLVTVVSTAIGTPTTEHRITVR